MHLNGADLAIYTGQVLGLGTVVWGAMKGISKKIDADTPPGARRHTIKVWTSWTIGPAAGVILYGLGFLHVAHEMEHPAFGWIGAAFFGGLGTGTAWGVHQLTKLNGKKKSKLPK